MAALKGTGRTEGPTSLDKKYRNLLDILTFLPSASRQTTWHSHSDPTSVGHCKLYTKFSQSRSDIERALANVERTIDNCLS